MMDDTTDRLPLVSGMHSTQAVVSGYNKLSKQAINGQSAYNTVNEALNISISLNEQPRFDDLHPNFLTFSAFFQFGNPQTGKAEGGQAKKVANK